MTDLQERDLRHIWHPCSQMKDYETLPPIVVKKAKGVFLYDEEGKDYIDIVSSWWCNLLGHSNERINQAVKEQLDRMEHVIFANFTHEGAIRLTEELLEVLPKGLTRFNFSDNGSAAVECALKMAFQYQYQTGHPEKQRFLCLSEGYHGETIGALSVGAMDLYAKIYQPMLMKTVQIEAPDCYRCPYGRERGCCNTECLEKAEEAFRLHGEECAALIVEPLLQGSAGMRIYPPEYLKGLRELSDRYGVLLIADEIATGFGRTGKWFASDHAGITPDILCMSKGLTGGYMPMAITATTEEIYQAFYADYLEGKAFMHSHTYSGNPLGCSAALAVQEILKSEPVFENAAKRSLFLTKRMEEELLMRDYVGEIRSIGLIHAIELVEDKKTKKGFPSSLRMGYQIYKEALKEGLLLRPLGNVLYFNPPLTITEEELEEALQRALRAIDRVMGSR